MATKPHPDHLQGQRPCAKCGARIGFLRSPTGASLVLDVKPILVALPSGESAWGYTSHWGTCPKAREVRAEMDAKRAGRPAGETKPASGETTGPSADATSAESEAPKPVPLCARCGEPGLGEGLPTCVECWNLMTPADQQKAAIAWRKIQDWDTHPEPKTVRPSMSVIVCQRGRRR